LTRKAPYKAQKTLHNNLWSQVERIDKEINGTVSRIDTLEKQNISFTTVVEEIKRAH
jgi:hypothetical protein